MPFWSQRSLTPNVDLKSKIIPQFLKDRNNKTTDRIVASFNKRDFPGFVTIKDADKILKVIGLSNEQHHGLYFHRSQINGMLYI
jgi:hypothetical protein